MYQPKYKVKHFVKQVLVTPDMVRSNRSLRRFMLIRRLVVMLNPAIALVLLVLFLSGVI